MHPTHTLALEPLPWVFAPPKSSARYDRILHAISAQQPPARTTQHEVILFTHESVGGLVSWRSLIADHEIRELLPGIACADSEPDSLQLRVALALQATHHNGIVARETARWIYEGGKVPYPMEAYYTRYTTRPQGKYVRGIRRRLRNDEFRTVLGLEVTTPQVTAQDLNLDYEILEPVIR